MSDDSGVPIWCAVSFAMPTQIERRSDWRITVRPQKPRPSSSSVPPSDTYGVPRSTSSTGGSP
jgi:hypothetical protein